MRLDTSEALQDRGIGEDQCTQSASVHVQRLSVQEDLRAGIPEPSEDSGVISPNPLSCNAVLSTAVEGVCADVGKAGEKTAQSSLQADYERGERESLSELRESDKISGFRQLSEKLVTDPG